MDGPLDRRLFGRSVTVFLNRPIGRHQTVQIVSLRTFRPYNYTFQSRPNGRSTYGPNTRCQGVHLDHLDRPIGGASK